MRVLVALVLALSGAGAGAASAQPEPGVIAYTRDPDGPGGAEPAIYVARPDGTGERRYATGHAPRLALGGTQVAYSVRSGGAAQLVVARLDDASSARQVTAFPDGEQEYGPGRFGVYGSEWSPSRSWLALRLAEGSTTTLAVVRPDGSGYLRLPFGHLYGSRLAWRDDTSIAVGTDEGLRLATVTGTVSNVQGSTPTDTPVAWLDASRVVVNAPTGVDVLDVASGKRSPLAADAVAWGVVSDGVVVTSTTDVAVVTETGERRPLAELPKGAQVVDVVAGSVPPLVEVVEADGTPRIYAVAPGGPSAVGLRALSPARAAALRAVANGSDVSVSEAASYESVAPPAAAPSVAPSAPVAASGPAASPSPGGPGAPAPTRPPAVGLPAPDAPPGRSAFTAAVPAANEVDTAPRTLAVSALVTLLLMVLVTFPAELFNSTLEEHYDEVRGWFRRRPRAQRGPVPAGRRVLAFLGYTAVAALLYGLLDPTFGLSGASARLYAGLLVGLVVVTLVFGAAPLAYARRRYGERGTLRVLPGTLVVGVVCVVISRAVRFEPGYLYGIVGGFAFARRFSADEEGRNALVAAATALGVSVLAWAAWQPVNAAAGDGSPGLLVGLAASTLATVALGGLEGLVIGLVPVRSLQGYALARWRRPAWAALYAVVLFTFVHLLLQPGDAEARPVPFWTWLGLFVGFGAASVAFWGYFRLRSEPT